MGVMQAAQGAFVPVTGTAKKAAPAGGSGMMGSAQTAPMQQATGPKMAAPSGGMGMSPSMSPPMYGQFSPPPMYRQPGQAAGVGNLTALAALLGRLGMG